MIDKVFVPLGGACPNCENPKIDVPEHYDENTVITCTVCGYSATHKKFFSAASKPRATE